MHDFQEAPLQPPPSLSRLFFFFLRLGATAFGGPAMIAYIRELAVGRKCWLRQENFQEDCQETVCRGIQGGSEETGGDDGSNRFVQTSGPSPR